MTLYILAVKALNSRLNSLTEEKRICSVRLEIISVYGEKRL